MKEMSEIKVGFLGFGNMGQAIAQGMMKGGRFRGDQVYASARNFEKLKRNTSEIGIQASASNEALLDKVDLVILAVKPHQVDELLQTLADKLKGKILISLVVGLYFEYFQKHLPSSCQHLSIMPNTPIQVGEGAIVVEKEHNLTDEAYALFKSIFEDFALLLELPSDQMQVAGVVSACGPAFVAIFIEAMADAAVKYGLMRSDAYRLASQTMKGTGVLQLESGQHPGQMKDAVTSPGGTTIKGVAALEENAFRSAVIQAFDAILEND